jgi:hypothetical protein
MVDPGAVQRSAGVGPEDQVTPLQIADCPGPLSSFLLAFLVGFQSLQRDLRQVN